MLLNLRRAIAFSTRVPVRAPVADASDLAGAVPWFPFVGALVGLLIGVVYAVLRVVLPALPSATAAVAFGVMLTGALHEDGVGDVADAFGGGFSREDVVRILKDSRQGTFGVLALVAVFVTRVTLVAAFAGGDAWWALAGAAALSRAASISLMGFAAPARADGLGAALIEAIRPKHTVLAVVTGAAIALVFLGVWVVPAAAGCAVVIFVMWRAARRKLGGVSGDVFGATQQLAELVVLAVACAVVFNGWPLPWQGF